jgi:hypothetical protein
MSQVTSHYHLGFGTPRDPEDQNLSGSDMLSVTSHKKRYHVLSM